MYVCMYAFTFDLHTYILTSQYTCCPFIGIITIVTINQFKLSGQSELLTTLDIQSDGELSWKDFFRKEGWEERMLNVCYGNAYCLLLWVGRISSSGCQCGIIDTLRSKVGLQHFQSINLRKLIFKYWSTL